MNDQAASVEVSGGPTTDAGPTPAGGKKKTVYFPVTMTDGRVVQFPGDTKAVTQLLKQDGSDYEEQSDVEGIRFDFRNGETRTITARDVEKWGLTTRMTVHGVSQKIRDNYASLKDVDDSAEATDELLGQLQRGVWSERTVGEAGNSVLLRALVEMTGLTAEEVRTNLSTCSAAEKIVLRNSDELRPIIQRLEAQRAGNVDKTAVLGRFGIKAA